MRRRGLLTAPALRLGVVMLFGALVLLGASACAKASASADTQTIVFRFSRFQPGIVTVPAGRPVHLTLRNDDPIEHEWIVGSEDVHQRHRTGTEPYHDHVPEEVTVPALSSRNTVIRFDEPGDYPFVCHLPGHEAYGMRGILRVVVTRP